MPKRPVKKPAPRKAKVKRHRVVPRKIATKPDALVLEVPREHLPKEFAPEVVVLEVALQTVLPPEPTLRERFVRWWNGD